MTDRIDGSPIRGSTITFSRVDGYGRVDGTFEGTARVNGQYELADVPVGDHRVVVTGPSHVEHTTARVSVTRVRRNLDFTVLEWGMTRFGLPYDPDFDRFFDDLARVVQVRQVVQKWDLSSNPPREFWVDPTGLSEAALNTFLELLEEVNAESISAMFGERVGALPVSSVSSTTGPSDGVILLRFWNQGTISDGYQLGDDVMRWGRVRFNRSLFVDYHFREFRKWEILHELFHVAFATHLTDENHARFPRSAMSAEWVQHLSAADRLASWIVYRDGTAPGNRAPDVNPTYAELGLPAGALSAGARVILPFRATGGGRPGWR